MLRRNSSVRQGVCRSCGGQPSRMSAMRIGPRPAVHVAPAAAIRPANMLVSIQQTASLESRSFGVTWSSVTYRWPQTSIPVTPLPQLAGPPPQSRSSPISHPPPTPPPTVLSQAVTGVGCPSPSSASMYRVLAAGGPPRKPPPPRAASGDYGGGGYYSGSSKLPWNVVSVGLCAC